LTCNDNAISTSEAAFQAIGSQLQRQDKRKLIHLNAQNNQGNHSTNVWHDLNSFFLLVFDLQSISKLLPNNNLHFGSSNVGKGISAPTTASEKHNTSDCTE